MTPIVVEFTVAASAEHAFDIWANRPSLWWPRTHTITGADELDIVFEAKRGGRIFERAGDGVEHDWGRVVAWDPPHRLSYTWHLFFDPSEATDIVVTFTPLEEGTSVRIEQSGWERLGAAGDERRARTENSWLAITPSYIEACERQGV